jgi:hypothetical protein
MNNNRSGILLYLAMFVIGGMLVPMMVSCGKSDVGAQNSNVNAQLQIVNLSPDLQAFNLYGRYIPFNRNAYSYPVASGYFLFPIIDTPIQIRSVPTSALRRRVKYTWFITGLQSDSSLTSILTTDTGRIPAIGRGKIRFVNASPNSTSLRITANDTLAFDTVRFKRVTPYIEVTAGRYNFKITTPSDPNRIIRSFDATVLDGKLYTFYGYGLVGRSGADTAAFGTGVILNTIPDTEIR